METIYLGWDSTKGGYYESHDSYREGFCMRCGRVRTECQKIIDTGKRCTELQDKSVQADTARR